NTAAVSSVTAAARASTSPYGTWLTSPGSGANGACLVGCPVSASAPIVRPWKPPCAATSLVRPVRRESLNAASLASVPELQNNTRASASPPRRPTSASASAMPGSAAYKLEVCPSVDICRVTASSTAGCPCPSTLTAMPPSRSRYDLPSTSVTTAPLP